MAIKSQIIPLIITLVAVLAIAKITYPVYGAKLSQLLQGRKK